MVLLYDNNDIHKKYMMQGERVELPQNGSAVRRISRSAIPASSM